MRKTAGRARAWLVGGVAAALVSGAFVVGVAGPASADPTTTFVGVGSDTIQDVMNQLASTVGGGLVGSYDAVDPVTAAAGGQIAPKSGCTMTRPNGSGQGLNALRASINPNTTAGQLADKPEAGCVDFARSSSGPAAADKSVNGALVYVPFALDAVAPATGPATAVTGSDPAVATNITHADQFTLTDLQTLYANCAPITEGGVTYTPNGTTTDATHQPIHLYVPQAGSGTRNFWLQTLGISTTGSLPPCVNDHVTINGQSVQVEEHDGTVFANDADALGPFSIAQWVAQKNGHHERRHNAVLHSLNGTAALTSAGALNTAYPITREVYNIVSFSRVTSTASADAAFRSIFNGPSSAICRGASTLINFGFALLNTAPLGHTCGQVANDLRAFDPASDPV
ncbi:substrate-binding domain-containing protein [Rugosimonospora acidiphila]|uniref:Substrate-binding domain-containing protein n=1 Tax=Rugosimonospora acidiphila TaxID=556531 RepID=A0ABP9RSK9_9ACTN